MPIDLGANANDRLNHMRRLFDNPFGWGNSVINTLDGMLNARGESLNSAAAVDAGTNEGNAPIISSNGLGDVLPAATQDAKGMVTESQVTDIPEAAEAIRAVVNVIGGGNVAMRTPSRRVIRNLNVETVRDAEGNVLYFLATSQRWRIVLSDQPSLLMISTPGQDAPGRDGRYESPSASGADANGAQRPAVLLSDANNDASTTRIYLNAGGAETVLTPTGMPQATLSALGSDTPRMDNERNAIEYLTQAQLSAFGFTFGFVLKGWGSTGGNRNFDTGNVEVNAQFQADSAMAFTNRMRTNGVDGDLLIAYKPGICPMYFDGGNYLLFPILPGPPGDGADGFVTEILL